MPPHIQVRTFPHDDVAFRAHVEAAASTTEHWDGERVLAEIRQAYPAATMQEGNKLGQVQWGLGTWYVYRDGMITQPSTGSWWLDEGVATTVMTADGQYVDANDAAAALFGVDAETIKRGRAGDFTRHEGNDEVRRRLFDTLAAGRALASTAVVRRRAGDEVPIEFRTFADSEHADRYVTVMRPIGPAST
jgi:PAS domain S-box-containing protein